MDLRSGRATLPGAQKCEASFCAVCVQTPAKIVQPWEGENVNGCRLPSDINGRSTTDTARVIYHRDPTYHATFQGSERAHSLPQFHVTISSDRYEEHSLRPA